WCAGRVSSHWPGPSRRSAVALALARSAAAVSPTGRPCPLLDPEVVSTRARSAVASSCSGGTGPRTTGGPPCSAVLRSASNVWNSGSARVCGMRTRVSGVPWAGDHAAAAAAAPPGPTRTPSPSPTPSPTPPPEPTWPLTGNTGDIVDRPAMTVKIENSIASRPQTGLQEADVVWEEMVEGGITRYGAVYHSR